MAVFEEQDFRLFSKDAVEHLREQLPEPTSNLDDEALLQRVRACIPVAESYGLSAWREIMAFVDATYLLDDIRFDMDPDYWWAQEILNCPHLSAMEKAVQLLDSAFAENQLITD